MRLTPAFAMGINAGRIVGKFTPDTVILVIGCGC
jgi:hypothetical protein